MPIRDLGPGTIVTADVREEINDIATASKWPELIIRSENDVFAVLNLVTLDYEFLLTTSKEMINGVIVFTIKRQLSVGQDLQFAVWTGENIPAIGAYLRIPNGKVKFLGRQKPLAAGKVWRKTTTLKSSHLQ
ncbi:MAG: hypothetical protein AAF465_10495 [Pseudomonadota bacterium]